MVSWLRSFELNWGQLGASATAEAEDLQQAFQGVRTAPNPRSALEAWIKQAEGKPGALFMPGGTFRKGVYQVGKAVPTSKVVTVHHFMAMEESDYEDKIVCLESLRAIANTVAVPIDDVISSLVSEVKASTKTLREKNIPPDEAMLSMRTEDIKKSYRSDKGDNTGTKVNSLTDWPCGVYVPTPLLMMIFNAEGFPARGTTLSDLDDPTDMLEGLVEGMEYLLKTKPDIYKEWKGMATKVAIFLWAVVNDLTQAVPLLNTHCSRSEVLFTLKRNQEVLMTEEEIRTVAMSKEEEATDKKPPANPRLKKRKTTPGVHQQKKYSVQPEVEAAASYDAGPGGGVEETKDEDDGGEIIASNSDEDDPHPSSETNPPSGRGEGKEGAREGTTEARASRTLEFDLPPPPEPANWRRGGFRGERYQQEGGRSSPAYGAEEPAGMQFLREVLLEMASSNREFMAGMVESNRLIAESNRASTMALMEQGAALKELTMASKESIDSKEAKNKATSNWLPADVFLLKALSAEEGWRSAGIPKITRFAESLFEKKNIVKATSLVRETGVKEQWCGGVLKSGLTEFIGAGFATGDIDAGPVSFSVLYCFASSYIETDSTDFRKQQVKDAFGESKGLTDEMITAFEKQQIFVPDNTYKCMEQLEVATAFLRSVCGQDTMAVDGYEEGRLTIKNNKKRFDDWARSDPQFLLKYLLFLDRMFFLFCKDLQEYEHSPDPILDARPSLEGWLVRNVQTGILPFIRMGIRPDFSVPLCLQGKTASKDGLLDIKAPPPAKNKAAAPAAAGKGAAVAGGGGGNHHQGGGGDANPNVPGWHVAMPKGEYVPEWQVPAGKRFGDFFGSRMPENNRVFPRQPHHKTRRPTSICARYQIEGARECRYGADCTMCHIRPKDIPKGIKDKITEDIQALYSSGGAAAK